MRMKIMKLGGVGLFACLEGVESFIYFLFLELRVFVSVTENTVSSCSLNVTHEVYFPAQKKISFVLTSLGRVSAKEENRRNQIKAESTSLVFVFHFKL